MDVQAARQSRQRDSRTLTTGTIEMIKRKKYPSGLAVDDGRLGHGSIALTLKSAFQLRLPRGGHGNGHGARAEFG